jgi:hypothetical protein
MMATANVPIGVAARRARERAERERVRALNSPVAPGPDGEDHAMDLGPAMQARGGVVERVGGRMTSTAQRKATPVYARMMDASTLFERMNEVSQLSDRQAKAGHRLWLLKRAAGVEPMVTARYRAVPEHVESGDDVAEVVESVCPDGFDPRTYYRAVLRDLPSHTAALLDVACDWTPEHRVGHPGVRWLEAFQFGLDRLAMLWGIKE